jgi:DNA-binding NarL/FixJ family response regulator
VDVDQPDDRRALVVDELPLVREGVSSVLRGRGFEDVIETRSAREAVSVVTMDGPDLLVCGAPADLAISDTARRLCALRPRPVVIALVPPAHEHVVAYLLALGVHGIGLRASDTAELGALVDAASKGEVLVAPALHHALAGGVRPRPLSERAPDVLSSREREVLVLLAEGRTNREIATSLSVTVATVKSHLVRIYSKLEASNRNEALGRAVSLGLLG